MLGGFRMYRLGGLTDYLVRALCVVAAGLDRGASVFGAARYRVKRVIVRLKKTKPF